LKFYDTGGPSSIICKHWEARGVCLYSAMCKFAHPPQLRPEHTSVDACKHVCWAHLLRRSVYRTRTCKYTPSHAHAHMYARTYARTHVRTHARTHACTHAVAFLFIHPHIHVSPYTGCIHESMQIHMNTYNVNTVHHESYSIYTYIIHTYVIHTNTCAHLPAVFILHTQPKPMLGGRGRQHRRWQDVEARRSARAGCLCALFTRANRQIPGNRL